jgi:hypothetical protein
VGKLPGKVLVDLEVCALLQLDSTVVTIRSITVKQGFCHIRQSLDEWAYFNVLELQLYSLQIKTLSQLFLLRGFQFPGSNFYCGRFAERLHFNPGQSESTRQEERSSSG